MRNGEIKREKRLYKKGIRELHDSVGEYIPVRGQRNRGGEMINHSWKLTVMVLPVGRRLFGRYCFFLQCRCPHTRSATEQTRGFGSEGNEL